MVKDGLYALRLMSYFAECGDILQEAFLGQAEVFLPGGVNRILQKQSSHSSID